MLAKENLRTEDLFRFFDEASLDSNTNFVMLIISHYNRLLPDFLFISTDELEDRRKFYLDNYDDNLCFINNKGVKIIGWGKGVDILDAYLNAISLTFTKSL